MMKAKQLGFTLLEILTAIAVMVPITLYLASVSNDSFRNLKEQNVAQYQQQVMKAASAYIKDNYATVAATATATTPFVLDVATLKAANYLPSGFASTNGFSQTACVLTLEPTANHLESLVVTEGGTPFSQGRVPNIANLVGSSGGYIKPDGVTAQGSYGSFTRNITNFISGNCSGTPASANHLASALFLDGSNLINNYVYRSSVPGHPEANTMTTPLIMSASFNAGDACTTIGSIARDSNGMLLSCDGSTYKLQGSQYWKDPVANVASLPTCDSSSAYQTRIVQNPSVGAGPRAYTCNGSSWYALSVDDSGNLVVPARLTADNIKINLVASAGSGCGPNGVQAVDSTGALLSCSSGVWKKPATTITSNVCPASGGTTFTVVCGGRSSYYSTFYTCTNGSITAINFAWTGC